MARDLFIILAADRRELETVAVPPRPDREALLADSGRRYQFDVTSTAQDVGDEKVVKPRSIGVSSPGRWVTTEPLRIIDRVLVRAMADKYVDHLFFEDPATPDDPPADRIRTWVGKNMAGRLQLRARFPNGNFVIIATQPGP